MDKREARKEFKSKKTPNGIFAIRCAATGEVWVSASDHLDSAKNGVWFQLRNGNTSQGSITRTAETLGEGALTRVRAESAHIVSNHIVSNQLL